MTTTTDTCYTLINLEDRLDPPSIKDLKNALEDKNDNVKIITMKKILIWMLNGDPMPQLLMSVIRYVLPSKNKLVKKLVMLYWEIFPKIGPNGKLKPEMILVCNSLRNDLQHPNEYIRGMTCRLVCKLLEPELLEPLIPTLRTCIEHRHLYVRKNAVFAMYSVYKNFPTLIPDATVLIYGLLQKETDPTIKRNAFVMLTYSDPLKAGDYLNSVVNQIETMGELMQLSIVEFVRKVTRNNLIEKARALKVIFTLLNSGSNSVRYEAAAALVTLTHAPTAIRGILYNGDYYSVVMMFLDYK
jgi:coatomer subunit beta